MEPAAYSGRRARAAQTEAIDGVELDPLARGGGRLIDDGRPDGSTKNSRLPNDLQDQERPSRNG